jgi:non-heme chloroperoxidase
MLNRWLVFGALTLLGLVGIAEAGPWHDPSPHKISFVTVDQNVRLEVLDWGGSGQPIVLLAASGATAHEFDDFAPKLAGRHHVYGITRRGYGASGYDPEKYGSDRLGDDVLAAMDALQLKRPILVGHSFAGAELSDIATRYPDRVAGLIYLEAAYTFAFRSAEAPTMEEFQQIVRNPKTPSPGPDDLASFATLKTYMDRMGILMPNEELRQRWTETADGRPGERRTFPGNATLTKGAKEFSNVPLQALVIFANPHSLGPWLDNNPEPSVQAAVKAYSAAYESFTQRQAKAVADGMPKAKVVILPGANHSVFISNQTEVLEEMNAFMDRLR